MVHNAKKDVFVVPYDSACSWGENYNNYNSKEGAVA